MGEGVRVEREDGVATVVLDRPERMNALDTELLTALPERLAELAHDPAVRCVVLTGAGERAFSAGGDIDEMLERGPSGAFEDPGAPLEDAVGRLQRAHEATWLLYRMDKPVLASLNGAAAGASLSLALACDLRIAAEHAVLTTGFAKLGFSGDFGGSWLLTRAVGTAKARELYYLSERVDAAEALRLGLVNWVVPRAALREETRRIARRLAEGPPLAYRYMKRHLNAALALHLREALDLEAEAMIRTGLSEDFRDAARAFLAKETPRFRGR